MGIANVALTDTFDTWRLRTNQIILYSNQLNEQQNLVFLTVNAAYTVLNAAYTSSNADYVLTNAAYTMANANYVTTNSVYVSSNANYILTNSAFARVNSVYDLANSNYGLTNAAFDVANAAFAAQNADFNMSNAAYTVANAAYTSGNANYVLTNATFTQSNTDNVRLSAAYVSSNAAYVVVNAAYTSINAGYTVANAAFARANLAANNLANTATAANNYAGAMANSVNAYTTATYVKLTSATQTITGDLSITGNLTLLGNVTTLTSNNLIVGDSLIYLAANNYSGTDFLDIGFIANYGNTSGANVHTGLIRDATDKQYYLFNAYDAEPANNTFVPGTNNMINAVLVADINTSNLTLGSANAIVWIKSAYDFSNGVSTNTTAAFAKANGVATGANGYAVQVGAASNTWANSVFSTQTNTAVIFNVANAAFGAANNVGPQIAPAYNTANVAFNTANGLSNGTISLSNIALTGTINNNANASTQVLTDGATISWNVAAGMVATVTLGGNRTLANPTNLKVGTYILHVIQDGTGSRTLTFSSSYKWPAGVAPILTTTIGARDLLSFVSDGTNLYGSFLPDVK